MLPLTTSVRFPEKRLQTIERDFFFTIQNKCKELHALEIFGFALIREIVIQELKRIRPAPVFVKQQGLLNARWI